MEDEIFNQQIEKIARVCHEANRAYCLTLGDMSQPSWDRAPGWQKDSCRTGVRKIIEGEITKPSDSHESWMRQKFAEGWSYGEVKDTFNKTHPCMVPHYKLPVEQQMKDELFFNIVKALSS